MLLLLAFPAAVCAESASLPFSVPNDYRELPERLRVDTTKGSFELTMFRKQATTTVANFVHLAKKGFYGGLQFHRYEPRFVIQGGDPKGDGTGGTGYTLPPEFSTLRHVRGTVGMARKPDPVNPERRSNGSQFYITLSEARHLDSVYTVFAQVTSGMEIVETLRKGDKILTITVPEE